MTAGMIFSSVLLETVQKDYMPKGFWLFPLSLNSCANHKCQAALQPDTILSEQTAACQCLAVSDIQTAMNFNYNICVVARRAGIQRHLAAVDPHECLASITQSNLPF